MSTKQTNVIDIFVRMAEAARDDVKMIPRSTHDKEYFAQDWFADRLNELSLPFIQQGRNSYPDFLVGQNPSEGFESKALAFIQGRRGGRPARRDIDFNSTIPSGLKDGRNVFLFFTLYAGSGASPRSIHTLSITHADLINCDYALADEHLNVAIHNFGSYADGFIRNRKMYVFPHPITIDPDGLGQHQLILPAQWKITDKRIHHVKTIERTIAPQAVDSYTIRLHGRGQAEVSSVPYSNAGTKITFHVFGLAGT